MDVLHYRRINGQWEVHDLNGHTSTGRTKEEAKRMYYLQYKINVNSYERNHILPIEDLTLNN